MICSVTVEIFESSNFTRPYVPPRRRAVCSVSSGGTLLYATKWSAVVQ